MQDNNLTRPYYTLKILSALIFSIAIVWAACLLANAWRKTHQVRDTIDVTGLAKKDFVSDLIVWNGSYTRKSMSMQEAYSELKKDEDATRRYLVGKGVPESSMIFSAVTINKEYSESRNQDGSMTTFFNGYRLTQSVQIESKEVDKIEEVSRQITELINSGLEFNSDPPQYYYTKLAELKIQMLAEATKDARLRAEKIAENAGSHISKLRFADMGIFQITAQNSAEDYSWGGTFNTASKRKTGSITAHLEFGIE